MILPFDETIAQLHESFDVPGDALERATSILELQHAALAAEPPPRGLPEAVALATVLRLRAGEIVLPRMRFPIEPVRVARLLRVLADLVPSSGLDEAALELVEGALPAAQADDGHGVLRAAERLGLPPEASCALLREAMKPEMLRISLPFEALVGDVPRATRCPLCGERPCAGTQDRHLCCRWCGMTWRWEARACPSCGGQALASREVERIVKGASLLQCTSCGDAVPLFAVSPDPLLLSMLAVLTSPLDLALRIAAEASPGSGHSVF